MHDICNYDTYFIQKYDAVGVLGLLLEQKLTAALRMLAYGAFAEQVDEIARMGKSTILECLVRFCDTVKNLYTREYLRKPTPWDLQRLLQKGEARCFPGMIGSIDCMHWQWKNCPTAWQGDYGNRKGQKSIILEAVASFDTWAWHALFGVAESQNDLNVLGQSPVFNDKYDAVGVLGLLLEQKLTAALRMLAYGAFAEQVDEIARMGKSTILECLVRFCDTVKNLYMREYLRKPTPWDLQRLLQKGEARCFPGMIGSIDCMHWQWKNCPTGWQGDYGNRKGQKSIILEAVASFDTWAWHALFGVAESQNDLNVLGQSPVFNDVLRGHSPQITYQINNTVYSSAYYLTDGIYPRWTTFVKTIPNPQSEKEKSFAAFQESNRKDVERCFGILQARWGIIRGAARMFDEE
ncbi:uncharacterized protein LOC110764053, partial [Prunus avium]|uniref:Uncharacterized protein LOC110764053 n=1 Tax=Prunus avium TaxID=42229 RepID=A0A6P5T746_PRUAV